MLYAFEVTYEVQIEADSLEEAKRIFEDPLGAYEPVEGDELRTATAPENDDV